MEVRVTLLSGYMVASLALAGCAGPLPVVQSGPDPADGRSPVVGVTYVPVTAGNHDYRPVEPKTWREQNERVAPGGRTSR